MNNLNFFKTCGNFCFIPPIYEDRLLKFPEKISIFANNPDFSGESGADSGLFGSNFERYEFALEMIP